MRTTAGGSGQSRWRRIPAAATVAAFIAFMASPTAAAAAAPSHRSGLIVPTVDGKLQGKHAEGIDQFLGVPYAAPPVGALRWQAPQPAQPWHGVRSATSYGNRCPQLASGNGPREDTEDCLFLNVFTPSDTHGRGLPVLVMIHGGGLVNGAGDQHDGSLIVNTDHIVVVSFNYRLGVFGFLDVPGLGTSPLTANGNYGLLDQMAALRWVQRNIAAFGGDPRRVTIAGESAGEGRTFTQGLASLTQQQYIQFAGQLYGSLAPAILQRYPWSAFPGPYTAAYAIGAIWTDSGFLTGIGGCPTQNLAARFASTTQTFFYQFDDRHAPGLNHNLPGYQWGAGHAMELAYLWPSFNNGFSLYDLLTPAQLQLSHQMIVWWGAFTRLGAPEAPGQPLWPTYTSGRLMSLRPGDQSRTITAAMFGAEHQCAFWNAG